MAQINKPSEYFNTVLYTGDGTSSNAITGVGFQPDWVWIKQRDTTRSHQLMDAVRTASYRLQSDTTNAESSSALTSFDSDGFTVDGTSLNGTNASGGTYVAWNWLANGAGVSNTDGSITSTVSANTTSGFSIVSYTGNGTSGATVGHGLGANPAMIIFKNRIDSSSAKWAVYHKSIFVSQADPNILYLEATAATADDTNVLGNSTVTLNSTVFSLGDYNGSNGNTDGIIAYCFAEKKGFSKFGTYSGASTGVNGTFVYTGFKPAFVLIKSYDGAYGWVMNDNKRNPYNEAKNTLFANNSDAEDPTYNTCDLLSNGFKLRSSAGASAINSATNDQSLNYIYMAFAEEPLVGTNNIPATAR